MPSKSLTANAAGTAKFNYLPTIAVPELEHTAKPVVVFINNLHLNYTPPDNVAELPYGYVVLSTNMGKYNDIITTTSLIQRFTKS